MPKKKKQETPDEQSARFVSDSEAMIRTGELDPTEADAALDKLVSNQRGGKHHSDVGQP